MSRPDVAAAALAFDTIQKFAEEGVTVRIKFDKRHRRFHVRLEGRFWDAAVDEHAEAIDVRLDQAIETALGLFRVAWTDHGTPAPGPEG